MSTKEPKNWVQHLLKLFGDPEYKTPLKNADFTNKSNIERSKQAGYAAELAAKKAVEEQNASDVFKNRMQQFYQMRQNDPREAAIDSKAATKSPSKALVRAINQNPPSKSLLDQFYTQEHAKMGQQAAGALSAVHGLPPDSPEYLKAKAQADALFTRRSKIIPDAKYKAQLPTDRLKYQQEPMGKIPVPLELTGNFLYNEEDLPDEGAIRGRKSK